MIQEINYKHMIGLIAFLFLVLYVKDLLNSPSSVNYMKDKLYTFVVGSNNSYINETFSRVSILVFFFNFI
jgi:hypothetical protein